jgi:hypothetical protein
LEEAPEKPEEEKEPVQVEEAGAAEVEEAPEKPEEEKEPLQVEEAEAAEVEEVPEKPEEEKEPVQVEEAEAAEVEEVPGKPAKSILDEFEKYKESLAVASAPGPVEPGKESKTIKGRTLRKAREKTGITIHEMAESTGISYKILVNIEKDRYQKLPEPGYLRWAITTYAKSLSLDPKKAAEDYMKRYRQWQREQSQES